MKNNFFSLLNNILYYSFIYKFFKKIYAYDCRILCYHSIGKENLLTKGLNITLDQNSFYKQLKILKKKYNIISYDNFLDCIKKRKFPKNSVLVTFDDGYKNFYINAHPILKELKIKSILFICSGLISNNKLFFRHIISYLKNIMKWEDCKNKFELPETDNQNLNSIIFKNRLVDYLEKKCNIKEVELANEFKIYMNEHEIEEVSNHHIIGNHTQNHYRLSTLENDQVIDEINNGYNFVLKYNKSNIPFSLPFGSLSDYNSFIKDYVKLNHSNIFFDDGKGFKLTNNNFEISRINGSGRNKKNIILNIENIDTIKIKRKILKFL